MKLPTASLIFFNAISRGSALRGATHEDSNSAASRQRAAAAVNHQGPHPLDRHLTEDGEEPWAALTTAPLKRTRDHTKLPGGGLGGGNWALDDSPNDSPDDTAADTSEISTTGCTFEIVNGDLYEVCDNGLAGLESAPELAGNIVEAPGDLDRQKNIWDFVSTFDGSFKTSSQYEL